MNKQQLEDKIKRIAESKAGIKRSPRLVEKEEYKDINEAAKTELTEKEITEVTKELAKIREAVLVEVDDVKEELAEVKEELAEIKEALAEINETLTEEEKPEVELEVVSETEPKEVDGE